MRDTAAIIVAGGKGLRYGGDIRKQYLLLRRRPIFWWSIEAFRKSPSISEIILVVPKDDLNQLLGTVPTKQYNASLGTVPNKQRGASFRLPGLRIVAGGATRADSVRQGLAAISSVSRYVAVHDAVRPLVTPALIENVIRAARKTKAALAACLSKDTVKIAHSRGHVLSSPSRDRVWLAQTPQIFERRLLERAHKKGARHAVTDDAQLVERLGVKVKLVESSPENLKVTLPMDFILARKILEDRS